MRTYKHQFEKVIEYGNLAKAINRSSLRKRDRDDVYDVFLNPDKHIKKITKQLLEQTWKPRKHRAEVINDGITQKKRLIIRPDFCYEQVIHHAVIQVMQPIFYKGMYEYSCGSIPDRGATLGQKYIEKYIRKNNISNPPKNCKWNKSNIKYVLKLDIHHFFQSININILKQKFANKIKDERMLWLLNTILQSNIVSFEGQDVDIGLPIGYYTSQWFANWYLQDLDHFIKEKLHIRCYVRYMDDMIMFGKNKKELKCCLEKIREFLKTLDLDIKGNWQIFRFDYIDKNGKRKGRPLDFIGFKFYRDKTILRKPIMYKATRKASKLEKKEKLTWYDACQVLSYMGYFKHSDTWLIREKYIAKKISIKACKSVISKHSKSLNLQKKQNSDKIKEKGEQNGDNIQKRAEKINDKPERVEKALNGWYIRKSFKSEEVVDPQNEEIKNIKYSYDEAFLTDDEYNIFLIGQEISGENYNSDAYLNYKAALDKPVIYPENGNKYKPLWVKNAQGEDGVYIDFLQKGEMFPELIYPISIWDATENPEKIVSMDKEAFKALVGYLGKVQEKLYTEYKVAKGQEE